MSQKNLINISLHCP